jgi:hypothetical protein
MAEGAALTILLKLLYNHSYSRPGEESMKTVFRILGVALVFVGGTVLLNKFDEWTKAEPQVHDKE